MTALLMLSALFVSANPSVIWMTAQEAVSKGIETPETGSYNVWVWAWDDGTASICVGGKTLTVEKPAKCDKKYVWLKAGRVDINAGKSDVILGSKTAMVVLSQNEEYEPSKIMGDTFVFNKIPHGAEDLRAKRVHQTNTVFTMPEFKTKAQWETLADRIRKRILLSSGLYPLPEKTPLNAIITDRIEHEDPVNGGYSVEKVRFEARPGFLVTGNLYRPLNKKGPFPGVANPHGHWETGRLANEELGSVPGRCITLARMGMVAFSYDMIGYNDSLQFEKHRWVDPKQKLWGIHPYAMQLWTSIRAIDFLQSLPDVDPERIGCTGASGGGTQTFSVAAVDPRIKVAVPVNMISHSMQGGCICENAPLIRLENSNMEIGALMAPRPMLMVSATGDWTRETPRVEFPAIQRVYALYGVTDHLQNVHIDAGHNYNQASREAMYRFFGTWLLNEPGKYTTFKEPPFKVEKTEDLRVFPDDKLPEGLPRKDEIIANIIQSTATKWRNLLPRTADETAAFHTQYGDVLALTLGTEIPQSDDFASERIGYEERRDKGYVVERWVLHRKTTGDAIPAILYRTYDATPQDTVVVVDGHGKAALADDVHGGPGTFVTALMAQGKAVLTLDVFLLGEHHSPFEQTKREVEGEFSDTFMPTDTGYRVQDVLTATAWIRSRHDLTGVVDLAGLNNGGLWCLFAAAIDGKIRKVAIDGAGFNPDDDTTWVDQFYIPCIRSIGDVDTAATLLAPTPLFVCNAPDTFLDGIKKAYDTTNAKALTVCSRDAMADWLH